MWGIVKDGEVQEILRTPRMFIGSDGNRHLKSVFELWSLEELAQVGCFPAIVADDPKPYSRRIGENWYFDGERVVIEHRYEDVPIEEARAQANLLVNLWKQRMQDGTFEYGGSTFQCDPRSRDFILGRCLDAFISMAAGQPYQILFRDAANIDHQLDAQGMIGLGRAAAEHVQLYHDKAKVFKEQIALAQTVDEIRALTAGIEGGM